MGVGECPLYREDKTAGQSLGILKDSQGWPLCIFQLSGKIVTNSDIIAQQVFWEQFDLPVEEARFVLGICFQRFLIELVSALFIGFATIRCLSEFFLISRTLMYRKDASQAKEFKLIPGKSFNLKCWRGCSILALLIYIIICIVLMWKIPQIYVPLFILVISMGYMVLVNYSNTSTTKTAINVMIIPPVIISTLIPITYALLKIFSISSDQEMVFLQWEQAPYDLCSSVLFSFMFIGTSLLVIFYYKSFLTRLFFKLDNDQP